MTPAVFRRPLILGLLSALLLIPRAAMGGSISLYTIPVHNTHQDYLCVFAGTSACPQDPALWPATVTDTNGDFPTLTHSYTAADLGSWNTFVGQSFVLGWDVNSSGTHQTLSEFTITMTDALNNVLASWTFAPAMVVPDVHNGEGWADYVIAAGCAGTTFTTSPWPIESCTQYQPFVVLPGTTNITFTFGLGGTGNDGHDDIFAIPYAAQPVPEPSSLILIAGGFLIVGFSVRRRWHARAD